MDKRARQNGTLRQARSGKPGVQPRPQSRQAQERLEALAAAKSASADWEQSIHQT